MGWPQVMGSDDALSNVYLLNWTNIDIVFTVCT